MRAYCDLHLHSCLSPCADAEMTPYNLVNLAKLQGYDVIALTDHNSILNCPAAMQAGREIGLTVLPGMELCTAEEIHVICLFAQWENAEAFAELVEKGLPQIPNRPEIFGEQTVVDARDNVLAQHKPLLTLASAVPLEGLPALVREYGGACFPAHIDRPSYSVVASLGTITPEMGFSAAEFADEKNIPAFAERFPVLKKIRLLHNSDAHSLPDMREPKAFLALPECTAQAVIDYLSK